MKQATFDLLDSELRAGYDKYLNLDHEDRYKLFTHQITIDPYKSKERYNSLIPFSLTWSIPHKYSAQLDLNTIIPSNDPGIYIFFVKPPQLIMDMPQFVIYVGIAGERGSGRSLKDRLKDYFYFSKIKLRDNIHKVFQLYYEEVYFSFALYPGPVADLEVIETLLHEYFSPRWSSRDYEPETKRARSAWGRS